MANRNKEEVQYRLNVLGTRIANTDSNIAAYLAQRDKLIDEEQTLQMELEAILAEEKAAEESDAIEETTEPEETPEVSPPAE